MTTINSLVDLLWSVPGAAWFALAFIAACIAAVVSNFGGRSI